MKILLKDNVLEAARKRIAYIFDEIPNVYVSTSGGKDSTVIFWLAYEEAQRRGIPLKVLFVDQEAEWDATIRYVRTQMEQPGVEPYWLQVPLRMSNSSSIEEEGEWLHCWKEGEEWLRPKEPDSIHENVYGTDRFKELFWYFLAHHHPDEKACSITGMRAEESRNRFRGLATGNPSYKNKHWASKSKLIDHYPHYSFHPIYDWGYKDVWKFIHENGKGYCDIYDRMYQYGVPLTNMRVSNLHHETALKTFYFMQEIEPEMWDKMTARLQGVHVARNLSYDQMFMAPKTLPWMFKSWTEYRDYLLDKLIRPDMQPKFRQAFAYYDKAFDGIKHPESLKKAQVGVILANDFHFTKLENWASSKQGAVFRAFKTGKVVNLKYSQWIPDEDLAAYENKVHYT